MDGLSSAASVIQVIQLSAQVLGALKTYYEVVRDCREDLARLYETIDSLKEILQKLKNLACDARLGSLQWCLNETSGPVQRLYQELKNLERKLNQITSGKKLSRATRLLKWPLSKTDIGNTTRVIREQCSIVTLELGLGSLSIQSQTIGILNDVRSGIPPARALESQSIDALNRLNNDEELVSNHDSLAIVEAIKADVAAGLITQSEIVGIITKIDTATAEGRAIRNQSVTILADIRKDIAAAQRSAECSAILEWLDKWAPSPSLQHNPLREQCVATTGTWLLEGDEFKSWIEADNSFMWINGGAGSGKSVLCSTVIDNLQKRSYNARHSFSSVIYWYCTFDNAATQDLSNFLCYLVRALCSNSTVLPQAIHEAYAVSLRGSSKPPTQMLKALLKNLFVNFDDVYLVIDALDEYPHRRDRIVSLINEIRAISAPSLHFLVTSRREGDICSSFEQSARDLGPITEISVQGEHVKYDIEKYMDIRLASKAFRNWTIEEKPAVKVQLAASADGMFRLVALQLDTLSEAISKRLRQEALANVPRFLDSFYERDLAAIPGKYREIVRRALLWILFSARPLTLAELAEALIIDPTSACVDRRTGAAEANLVYVNDDDRLDDDRSLLEILPASIVRTVAKPKFRGCMPSFKLKPFPSTITVQFSHYSVQEYLLSDRNAVFETPVAVEISQALLAESCIAYAHYMSVFPNRGQNDGVSHDINDWDHYNPPKALDDEAWYALRKYVRKNWTAHIRAAGNVQQPLLERMLAESFSISGPLSKVLPYLARRDDDLLTGLDYLAKSAKAELYQRDARFRNSMLIHFSLCGSNRNLRLLLQMVASQDSNHEIFPWLDTTNGRALQAASSEGHTETVRILLEAGFDCNSSSSGDDGHALQAAALNGHQHAVALLLKHGADINYVDKNHGTALMAAALGGHTELVNLLLEHGADVNILDCEHGSALQAAVFNGHIKIARMLIEHGANINVRGGKESSPLEACVSMGHATLVEILLSHGASPNRLDNPERTEYEQRNQMNRKWSCPLEPAAEQGDPKILALLLKYGAEVNQQHKGSGRALQAAAYFGHVEVVALLIEHGADVNSKEGSFGSVLEAAATGGQSGIIATLIAHGAKVNNPEDGKEGELQKAVRSGNLIAVTLLLEHGADVNRQCGRSGTALHLAAHVGQEEQIGFRRGSFPDTRIDNIAMIDLLMKYGADVNAQGACLGHILCPEPPGSVLHAAATISNTAIVESIIRYGADVNAYAGRYGYALHCAAMRGEVESVSLLLKNGADVNATGGEYGYALHCAAIRGNVGTVSLLLKNGADANAHGGENEYALHCAAMRKSMRTMRLRPKNGANINAQDGTHGTALQPAVSYLDKEINHFLLQQGASVNIQDGKYGNALQIVIDKGLWYTSSREWIEIINLLLAAGAEETEQQSLDIARIKDNWEEMSNRGGKQSAFARMAEAKYVRYHQK
ncbi:hypothetical protein V492_02658 [Pseudogymnoascus sp. VKM F-4246]|nr:hypothetical protein V492_02658 [Pseudogymnoascus sp. VKM F-4246]